MKLTDLVKPTSVLLPGSQFVKSPELNAVLDDWNQGKFQTSDLPALRGIPAEVMHNVTGINWMTDINKWLEAKAPNVYGNSQMR